VARTDEQQIKAVIEDRLSALREKDAERFLSHFLQGFSSFEIGPPLQYLNNDPGNTAGLDEWFSSFDGRVQYEMQDLNVVAGPDVAFSHCLYRMRGKKVDGETIDIWARQTLCFRKSSGRWVVAHTHMSVPMYMDESKRAAVDLTP
jgi:ketosteroid isomerase-like protein